ncbi:MAG: TadE/TadG family type IV pilus assembly protein [Pseudomonadota bacterium]
MLKTFIPNKQGNIAILAGVLLPLALMVIGAAIDYERLNKTSLQAQELADATALQVARNEFLGEAKSNSISAGKKHFKEERDLRIDLSDNAKALVDAYYQGSALVADVSVTGTIPTTFLRVIGQKELSFSAASSATTAGGGELEIALVLDVSYSMLGDGKITELQTAARTFIESTFGSAATNPDIIVSIIPYTDTVRFPISYADWLDPGISAAEAAGFEGCFNHQTESDLDTLRPTGARPGFFRGYLSDPASTHPSCPPAGSEALLFSSSKTDLITKINALQIGSGTGSDTALAWGWRALAPEWRGEFKENAVLPRDHASDRSKVLVFLTDGRPFRHDADGDGINGRDESDNEEALDNLEAVCDAIEAAGNIDLYTIGFDVNDMDSDQKDIIEACTAGGGQYINADKNALSINLSGISYSNANVRIRS